MSTKAKEDMKDSLHGTDHKSALRNQEPLDIMQEMGGIDPERAMTKLETTQTTGTNEPYSIFSKRHRYAIGVLGSMTGLLSPLTANIYLPALIAIQKVHLIFEIEAQISDLRYMKGFEYHFRTRQY